MIKIGDTLTLESTNGKEVHEYKCKVIDVFPNHVHIDYPVNMKTGKTVFLLNGMQFKASFVGKDDNLYLFDTEVTGKVRDPVPMVVLSYPGEEQLVRVQRRQYVRVEANVDVAIHPLHGEFSPFTTMTTDISAGGAAIVLPQQVQQFLPGMVVEAWLVLCMKSGDYHYLKLPAKVIRVFQAECSDVYRASLQFLTMSPQERLLLIRYSFERQLELRQKEE
ncbi:flagellar brake protein [Thermaerobacillus caldiproteolyticus]|uniref:C-di-GMP-binding flagellar brake protein YcgR n=1 Tax=Thermaerobacillus caldiproteolyticus TaxID=247480 RepID=A0A7W0C097_9BACL|nr:flagellar brake domain-containing protein [Anoxybacillus caldiproteolyticus]MBA2875004.1 c-di-GMP-binding flagellar brake protein YcgR [Anoxybacillus caldiproteolyticus]QPA33010.1 flagellar brake domain-containing protein [Anoxybacillus caldiproteolyticus]